MPDETLPETPPPATTPPAATAQQSAAGGAPAITPEVQAVIDARVREAVEHARNATWKQARETLGKKTQAAHESPPAQQPAQSAATSPAPASSLDIARVVMFTTEASKLGIPPKGVELLLSKLDAEKPADVSSWVAQQAADFGWKPPTPSTVTPAAQAPAPATAPPAAAMPPVTGNAAPSGARVTDDVPLIDRSPAEQAAFQRQHGFVAFTDRVTKEARERSTRLRLR